MTILQSPGGEAERRAWNYWFEDGLPNLVAGVLCLLPSVAMIFAVQYRDTHIRLAGSLLITSFAIYFVFFIRFRKTIVWLKSWITYPRTGYASPPYFTEFFTENYIPPADLTMLNLSGVREKETFISILVSEDAWRRGWFFLGIVVAAALVGEFIPSQLLCAVVGLMTGAIVWLVARRDERMSWTVAFVVPFALGYSMYGFSLPHIERVGFFMTGIGSMLALTGATSLIRYLRRNPARQG